MTWTNERFGIGSVLRPIGHLLLISLFVFQMVAPAAATVTDSHAHHQGMADAAITCPMHIDKSVTNIHGEVDHEGTHENAVHCMPSMCCFQDTVSSSKLVAVGMLLPGAQTIDRGKSPSSTAGSAQERPPRHV